VEQTNLYYQQHLGGRTGPARRLLDITLPDMMMMMMMNFFSSLKTVWLLGHVK